MKKIPREFYTRENTLQIAREILGKVLVVPNENGERVSGKIVEVEAYLGEIDKAAHSFEGRRTERNKITYEIGGKVYVFFIYGMYWQLNFVTNSTEVPHVLLIRAVEPIDGIEIMRERRGKMKDQNLTSGPGKLCLAFGIDRSFNGEDLVGSKIWVENAEEVAANEIETGKRIGIDYAEEFAEMPWRFWIKGNKFVSRK
ncbi:MAG: DNA-3-methyladenine glycosylase [Pyrinomonadaceae bacterium]|nr:DNA-3-methyladenine glycosylase [Pyrinomonadaceae bacterium]